MPYLAPQTKITTLNPDLLQNPADFKARAFLDAHRGETMHLFSNKFRPRCNADRGWGKAIRKHWASGTPIPDHPWGTGCTPELWATAAKLSLSPSCLAIWLWLHSVNLPILTSGKEFNAILGNVDTSNRTIPQRLIRYQLILASEVIQGLGFEVRRVYDRPTGSHYSKKWRIHLLSPDGQTVPIVGSLSAFARKHGLCNATLHDVTSGKRKQHRGWRLAPQGTLPKRF